MSANGSRHEPKSARALHAPRHSRRRARSREQSRVARNGYSHSLCPSPRITGAEQMTDRRHESDDSSAQSLLARAQAAWAAEGRTRRWTFWIRLSWATWVDLITAQRQVEEYADRMRRRVPGAAILVGFHTHAGALHAHLLMWLPPVGTPPTNPTGEWARALAQTWIQRRWHRGLVHVDRYQPYRARSTADPRKHGAPEYLSGEVSTVMMYGKAPEYRPRRTRR